MKMDPKAGLVIGLVIIAAVAVFLWPRPLPPPHYNEIVNDPPESELDRVRSTNTRLFTAESNPDAIVDSINEVHFQTDGQDICLFGNFTSIGNGDTRIDFMILTEQGYWDFLDDGFVDSNSVFMQVNDSNGFYWERVLPHFYNGESVTTWFIVYSAFRKPWWQPWSLFERQYRDVSAKACRDYTPPNCHWYIPEDQPTDRMLLYVQVYDDRCNVNYMALLVNGTEFAYSPQSSVIVQGPVEWPFEGLAPGTHILNLTIYAEDEVGNWHYVDVGLIPILVPDTFKDVMEAGSIILAVVVFIAIFMGAPIVIVLLISIVAGVVGTGAISVGSSLGIIGLVACIIGCAYFSYRLKYPRK